MKMKIILLLMGIFLTNSELFSQFQFGPEQTDYRRPLRKYQSNPVQSDGLEGLNTQIPIGRELGPLVRRLAYQWDILDIEIPDNSEINSVTLTFTYSKLGHEFELGADLYNISYDILSEDNFDEIFAEMDYTAPNIGYDFGQNNQISFQSNDPNGAFNQSIRNSLINNKFVLGVKFNYDHSAFTQNRTWGINSYSVTLYIEYTPPNQNITIDQRLSTNAQVGTLKKWEGAAFGNPFNPGSIFSFPITSIQTIQGSQTEYSNQKYNNWNSDKTDVTNHHPFEITPFTNTLTSRFESNPYGIKVRNSLEGLLNIEGGIISFKDPWLIDYNDPLFANTPRNQGMSAPLKDINSPLDFALGQFSSYKGAFLNQLVSGQTYYSARSLTQDIYLSQTSRTHKFYFQNWSGTGATLQDANANETGVVITSSSAVVNANLKGTQLSSQTNAYINNSQRKFVRTDDGWLHSVYESMGRVWYETKSPSDGWKLMNDGKPLDTGEGKQPSIDYSSLISPDGLVYQIVIVYQEKSGSSSKIRIKYFKRLFDELNISFIDSADIATISASYSTTNTTPVVGFHQTNAPNTTNTATVIWKNGTGNLYGWYGTINSIIGTIQGPNSLTGTTSNSINPTIYVAKIGTRTTKLAWEETGTGGAASIKYAAMGNSQISGSITTPSTNSGYTKNYQPSIIEFGGGARLCWIGYIQYSGGSVYYYVTVFKDPAVVTQFWNFGNEVRTVNINRTADGNYVVGWSEVNGSAFTNKYVRNTTLSAIKNFGTTGKDIQVNNGANFYSQYANSFQSVTAPYNFSISNSVGNIGKEQAGSLIASGREGVVYKEDAQFYFTVGDLMVNNQNIDFVEVPDTLNISSREILNSYLISNPFEVNDNSTFTYGVQYGITDSASGSEFIDEDNFINFKVELIDDVTGELLGLFDDVTFTKTNLNQYNNISYQVNTQGIGNRTVRLKLVVNDNLDPGYSLSHKYADESVLPKAGFSTVNYKGSLVVESYDLAQNYPNPFNPSTTIKYQIPEDGMVTMKIYDILGKEVKSLVNEQKVTGRYEIQFDASNLASGVYIYRLQVNNFVSSKKMILLR